MRSARTGRPSPAIEPTPQPAPAGFAPRRTALGLLRCWAIALALPILLAGCSGGSVNEARLGQARDAQATTQLDNQQATFTARQFFPPTPSPTAAPPPLPTLESLVITLGIGAGDAPQSNLASVPADTGVLYASASLHNLTAGQQIEAVWTDMFGTEVGTAAQEAPVDAGQQWISLPLEVNGRLAPGDYAVFLFVDDRPLGSLVFVVGPPGSVAQEFPPPPDNPQVGPDPTQPTDNRRGRDRDGDGWVDPVAEGDAPPAEQIIDPNTGQPAAPTFAPR